MTAGQRARPALRTVHYCSPHTAHCTLQTAPRACNPPSCQGVSTFFGGSHLFHLFHRFRVQQGASAFFAGLRPTLMGIAPYSALSFAAFETLKVSHATCHVTCHAICHATCHATCNAGNNALERQL